jgi:hypothetical protein
MCETSWIPNIIWIILRWQAIITIVVFSLYMLRAIARWLTPAPGADDAPQDAPPAYEPPPQHDAPGLRTVATFEAFSYEAELDAEPLDVSVMFETLMERMESIGAEIGDFEETYDETQRIDLQYRDERYGVALSWDGAHGTGTLKLDHVDYHDDWTSPSDSFATRELLMELHRFLRQSEVCHVRWHARQNLGAGNADAYSNSPF